MASAAYTTNLNTHLSRYHRHLQQRSFIHDGSSTRTAKSTREWFEEQKLDIIQLPPHSPQFNAIEEVRAWIKHKVRQSMPTSAETLRAACQSAIDSLPQEVVKSVIRHAHDNIVASWVVPYTK